MRPTPTTLKIVIWAYILFGLLWVANIVVTVIAQGHVSFYLGFLFFVLALGLHKAWPSSRYFALVLAVVLILFGVSIIVTAFDHGARTSLGPFEIIARPLIIKLIEFTRGLLLIAFGVWSFWALDTPPVRRHFLPDPLDRSACPACGYSRQGLTTKTCPECGTPLL